MRHWLVNVLVNNAGPACNPVWNFVSRMKNYCCPSTVSAKNFWDHHNMITLLAHGLWWLHHLIYFLPLPSPGCHPNAGGGGGVNSYQHHPPFIILKLLPYMKEGKAQYGTVVAFSLTRCSLFLRNGELFGCGCCCCCCLSIFGDIICCNGSKVFFKDLEH